MSYPRSLDEIATDELLQELTRRMNLKESRRCTYCERPYTTSLCQFPERHHGKL